jgi:rhodanese-related sulfurtransferase
MAFPVRLGRRSALAVLNARCWNRRNHNRGFTPSPGFSSSTREIFNHVAPTIEKMTGDTADVGKLDKGKPTAVYCDSCYRGSIATSILQQQGFGCVCNIPGSWQAWKNAGYPVEKETYKEEK